MTYPQIKKRIREQIEIAQGKLKTLEHRFMTIRDDEIFRKLKQKEKIELLVIANQISSLKEMITVLENLLKDPLELTLLFFRSKKGKS